MNRNFHDKIDKVLSYIDMPKKLLSIYFFKKYPKMAEKLPKTDLRKV